MKKTIFAFALSALSFAAIADVGIASGQKTGTNYPMTQDIVDVCSKPTNKVNNVISDGSIDNIFKIYGDKSSQFGIVQEDALVYQAGIDPKMMSRVVAVFPFFSVEVHLIVKDNSNIKSLADLAGKRVVEGPEGSGTWVTTQVIKAQTGIEWETVPDNLSQADGLKAVQTGKADAEFIVAGKPIGVLKSATGVKLVPVKHNKLESFAYYTGTMLPTGTYPFQSTSVQTYKVTNVLATFAFKNQFQAEIGDLVTCITKNIGTLQAGGQYQGALKGTGQYHEKWRDVDPTDIDRVKWATHPSAVAAIKRVTKK